MPLADILNTPRARHTAMALAVAIATFVGCQRGPQLSADNRRLVATLRTAFASQRADWVEGVEKQIEDRRRAGKISDAERTALENVIIPAKTGDWETALARLSKLASAQQPTDTDLERLKPGKR